jgi:hypothetical protein
MGFVVDEEEVELFLSPDGASGTHAILSRNSLLYPKHWFSWTWSAG